MCNIYIEMSCACHKSALCCNVMDGHMIAHVTAHVVIISITVDSHGLLSRSDVTGCVPLHVGE